MPDLVLLGTAERQDASVVLLQVLLDLHPRHLGDLHATLTPGSIA